MSPSTPPRPLGPDPRVVMAAERTLLAWIRTGLAMMGFGFVVAKFGLFLHEIALLRGVESPAPGTNQSIWLGFALVVLGVVSNLMAAARHARAMGRLGREYGVPAPIASDALAAATLLAAVGIAMALYLVRL